jgi:dienelactone hydrolase
LYFNGMRRTALSLVFLLIALGCNGQTKDSPESLARKLVEMLSRQEFAKAYATMDETMAAAITEEKLSIIWKQIQIQNGAFTHQKDASVESTSGYTTVRLTCAFEKSDLIVQLSYDPRGKVAGLYFKPPKKTAPLPLPSYMDTSKFTELPATVSSGEYALLATLSMPKGTGPFPAVVLVHGSGPNDRDESIGPNKPFRDLAWGLASQGIAVLRYEKRTRSHPKYYQTNPYYTVKDEVTDDADSALALLRRTKGVNAKSVYLLGHSLGAYLAPRIALGKKDIAGVIMLAAPTRHLEDLVVEQTRYIAENEPQSDKATMDKQIEMMDKARTEILALKPSDSAKTVLGVPGSYWLDLAKYDVVAVAKQVKVPMLLMQGERDYQVTATDLNSWKQELAGSKNVTIKSYPKLNHLFFEGEGKGTPSEYDQQGYVAVYVVEDISSWVKTLK